MGISIMRQVRTQSQTYLGNIKLPGMTFIGAIYVVNKTPVKMAKKVSVKYTSKKLSLENSHDLINSIVEERVEDYLKNRLIDETNPNLGKRIEEAIRALHS